MFRVVYKAIIILQYVWMTTIDRVLEAYMSKIRIVDLPQLQATLQQLTTAQIVRVTGGSGFMPSAEFQQDRQIVKGNKWGA
jgi:hypothetical protein